MEAEFFDPHHLRQKDYLNLVYYIHIYRGGVWGVGVCVRIPMQPTCAYKFRPGTSNRVSFGLWCGFGVRLLIRRSKKGTRSRGVTPLPAQKVFVPWP